MRLLPLLLALSLFAGCTTSTSEQISNSNSETKISIGTSFYPLAFLAESVGGAQVEVTNVTPSGAEPHDFEPTPKQIAALYDTQIFFYHGAHFDPWAEKLASELAKRDVKILVATNAVKLLPSAHENEEETEHAGEIEEEAENFDPHIWNDPILFASLTENVRDILIEIDPAHAMEFRANAEELKNKFNALDAEYRATLTDCRLDTVIVNHNAFAYLGKRYDITFLALSGLSPELEPTLARLAELTRIAREQNIRYILFESLASPRVAETLAREVGASTLVLNPLEGLTPEETKADKNFLDLMRANLKNLAMALECGKKE